MKAKEAAAQKQIRVRTVGDARFAAAEQIQLFFGQIDSVRQDSELVEQPIAVVDVRVLRLREELLHPQHLGRVFGDVSVDVGVAELPLQVAGKGQQFGG